MLFTLKANWVYYNALGTIKKLSSSSLMSPNARVINVLKYDLVIMTYAVGVLQGS